MLLNQQSVEFFSGIKNQIEKFTEVIVCVNLDGTVAFNFPQLSRELVFVRFAELADRDADGEWCCEDWDVFLDENSEHASWIELYEFFCGIENKAGQSFCMERAAELAAA